MQTFSVLHSDEDVIAIDKPPGISVIPGRGEPVHASLRFALERFLFETENAQNRLWVVHRLDRDVSGALVFARTAEAHRALSLSFEHGQVEKTYWALVDGVVKDAAGAIDLPLRTGGHGGRTVVDLRNGKPSVTSYRVRERFERFTVLEVEPRTGRTHQVRVHLRALGHPLAVDRRYGSRAALHASDLHEGAAAAPRQRGQPPPPAEAGPALLTERAALHAERIRLPLRGGHLEIRAPLPRDLSVAVDGLRARAVTIVRQSGGGAT